MGGWVVECVLVGWFWNVCWCGEMCVGVVQWLVVLRNMRCVDVCNVLRWCDEVVC